MKITKINGGYNVKFEPPFWVKCLIAFYILILISNLIDKIIL